MAQTSYLSKAGLQKLLNNLSATFVLKEDGKGLFSGSYTDLTDKPTKLSDFENDLDLANLDSIAEKYLAKTDAEATYVKITDYEAKIAELEQADTDNLAAAKKYTDDAVGAITGFDFQIVEQLPDTGSKGIIYLVAATDESNVESESNYYDEYIWVDTAFEHIGTTKMDLTGYLKEIDIAAITNDEIDQACTTAGITVATTSEPSNEADPTPAPEEGE